MVTDKQVRILMKLINQEKTLLTAAAKAGMCEKTARKYRKSGKLPSQCKPIHDWPTHEDAFKTIRMLKTMKYVFPSISYYAPYPGSALGYQLIAEGKSLMSKGNYHRFPGDEKVKGIDYQFYRELLAGKYDQQVNNDVGQNYTDVSYEEALVKA